MKNLRLQIIVLHVLFSLTIVNAQEKLPDSDPKLISETTYKIPQSAIDAEIDGKVGIGFRIDKTGTPIKANVIAGPMWPCSTKPIKALDDLYADLSKEMLKLRFSPAIKNGKPVEKEVGLAFMLENPRFGPKPADVDPITGKFKVTTINGGILNGKATSLPKPVYPDDAKAHRDSGNSKDALQRHFADPKSEFSGLTGTNSGGQ